MFSSKSFKKSRFEKINRQQIKFSQKNKKNKHMFSHFEKKCQLLTKKKEGYRKKQRKLFRTL
jgi:hypothetical protein